MSEQARVRARARVRACVCVCVCVCVCAVPNVSVFCSSLRSRFPGMLLRYFLSDSQMVPVPLIITGITSGCCTFHIRCISVARAVYFRIFLTSFLITFITILLLLLLLLSLSSLLYILSPLCRVFSHEL